MKVLQSQPVQDLHGSLLGRYRSPWPGTTDDLVRDLLLFTPEEHMARHERLLLEILAYAERSPLYKGRLAPVTGLNGLSSLPITSYDDIFEGMERLGPEKVLLSTPVRYYQTSGSTGSVKRIYVGEEDLERVTQTYLMYTHILGVRPTDIGWNIGGTDPLVSGHVIDLLAKRIPLVRCISTPLSGDTDLVKALKIISKEEKVDVIAAAALVFYLVGRMATEEGYLKGLVVDKIARTYKVPRFLAGPLASIFLFGLDVEGLVRVTSSARMGMSYAEPVTPYLGEIGTSFPNIRLFDVYGSTENAVTAAQLDKNVEGLSFFLDAIIPEIADPKEVTEAKADPSHRVSGVPWYQWQKGMIGELIVTRPGQCLPLVRYPTGDVIEVLEPAHETTVMLDRGPVKIVLPLIKVLGRSVDMLDFSAQDEVGNFLGNKIYSRYITEALNRSNNVRWWELYHVRGNPGRLVFLIIPERDVGDVDAFKKDLARCLLRKCDDYLHTLKVGYDLGRLDIMVARAEDYSIIQAEIDRRIKEGRPIGQLKPKHIFVLEDEETFQRIIAEKMA